MAYEEVEELDDEVIPEGTEFINSEIWTILALGLAGALLVFSVNFFNRTFACLMIIIHEFGHCVTGLLFGYPSLPALDFKYGGGVTIHQSHSLILLMLVYLALAGAIYLLWNNPKGLAMTGAFTVLFALSAHTFAHRIIILFAGHGAELVMAVVFILRAMSASGTARYAERPLYAACGLYFVLKDTVFAWDLVTSVSARARYGAAKGGGHWMDFSRISRHLGTEVNVVAGFFLLCCIATPIVALLIRRYRSEISNLTLDIFSINDAE